MIDTNTDKVLENTQGKSQSIPHTLKAQGRASWTRVLAICTTAFFLWLVLDAPTLYHNAQVQAVGTRRTVALHVLAPIAQTSKFIQFSRLVPAIDRLIGRTGNQPGDGSDVISGSSTIKSIGHMRSISKNGLLVTSKSKIPRGSRTGKRGGASLPMSAIQMPAIIRPTTGNPLRVLIVGDSLGIDLGGALQNDLENTGVVTATLDARESTGLTRPDYFNWPAELQSDLNLDNPQVVVIMMGANDPQDFLGPPDIPYGTAQWNSIYAQRVSSFMQLARSAGAQVIWVGMPPMQNAQLNSEMVNIDAIDRSQAMLQRPPVTYISSWTILGTPQGQYTAFIANSSGQEINIRTPDGIHIAPGGSEILAQRVLSSFSTQLHIFLTPTTTPTTSTTTSTSVSIRPPAPTTTSITTSSNVSTRSTAPTQRVTYENFGPNTITSTGPLDQWPWIGWPLPILSKNR